MNNKICVGIFYTFFIWHFELCSTQTPLKKIVEDIDNSKEEDVEKLEDYKYEDVENLENDSKKVDEMDQSNVSLYDNDDKDLDKNIETYEDMGDERSKEKQAGDYADLFGTNPHYSIPTNYEDFGRRFVLTYPYFEKNSANNAAEAELDNTVKEHMESKKLSNKLVPMKAPPEFVLAIAKESALLEAAKPKNPADEVIKKDILRTGDYWDGVWKEDVDLDQILRSSNNDQNKLKNSANNAAEAELDNTVKEHMESKKLSNKLVPMKAPPEFVLAIAKESALLEAAKPKNPADEVIKKDILRTGDYWDGVWKEDVDLDQILRSSNNDQNKLESFPVEISPGSKLYDLISILIQKSPRLLYVINK